MTRWALSAIVLLGSDAAAQSVLPPAPPNVRVQTAPTVSSATAPLQSDWQWKFDLGSPPADDSLWKWRVKTSLSAGRDTILTFGVIGQRGYQLPTYMSESLASGTEIANLVDAYVDPTGRRTWDAHVHVARLLFTTRRGTTVRGIADVLIPLGKDNSPPAWQSMVALRSKAVRVGLAIGF